jgi:predicted transcriptional regulator
MKKTLADEIAGYNPVQNMKKPKQVLVHINPATIMVNGQPFKTAKFFPIEWWNKVVSSYPAYRWVQIGMQSDWVINGVIPQFNLSLSDVKRVAMDSDYVICVDSFLQHLLAPTKKKLIVLWTKSDPEIYGYPWNINLLKDRKLLRPDQYGVWAMCPIDASAFIDPQEVIKLLR